jgi:hypothetical protein
VNLVPQTNLNILFAKKNIMSAPPPKFIKLLESAGNKLSEVFGKYEQSHSKSCYDRNVTDMEGYVSCLGPVFDRLTTEKELMESKLVYVQLKLTKCLGEDSEDRCYDMSQDLLNRIHDSVSSSLS